MAQGDGKEGGRVTGLETEYGCLSAPTAGGHRAVARVRDWIFENNRYGLIDLHERGWEEPPGNGGFLFNGGRLYVDMGHLEYCTAECATAADVVKLDRAGDRMIQEALRALGLEESVQFIRNNVDHRSGATFGCHENYSLLRRAPFTDQNVLSLLTFLTLRLLFTGSGRVGGALNEAGRPATDIPFQISQRADFIQNDFYEWVQHNRAIINTRDEPLADPRLFRRLHLLHGDTNVLPSALYLKVGATRLVLDLLELDDLPALELADAVATLRTLSRQPTAPWSVTLAGGREADPVELLSRFRLRAVRNFAGRDAETDAVLALWSRAETGLASDPSTLVGLVDWITKRHLLDQFRISESLEWTDPWLEAQDLEYHQIDPSRSLGLAMADLEGPWAEGLDQAAALTDPPAGTRATTRSRRMREAAAAGRPYAIDWHCVREEGGPTTLMLDPLIR